MKPDSEDLIEVRASGIHGLGAFARRGFAAGTPIGVYVGRRYTGGECDGRDWNNALTYVFGFADGSFVDGSEGGNETRHLNHSCAPNCVAYEVESDEGEAQIVIEAKRRIRAGEELFIDYALDIGADDPADYPCRCGAARCRGTMAAPEESTE